MSDRADLEIILRSHFPLVTVNTDEEVRAVNLFRTIAPRVELPLSRWTSTDGLDSIVGDATFNPSELRLVGETQLESNTRSTTEPEYALRVIRNAKQPGIILLLDFHPFLSEPVNVRLIKEIAQDHDVRRQKLVFVSHTIELPAELVRYSAGFNLKLPNSNQIGRIITEESAIWASQHVGENVLVEHGGECAAQEPHRPYRHGRAAAGTQRDLRRRCDNGRRRTRDRGGEARVGRPARPVGI